MFSDSNSALANFKELLELSNSINDTFTSDITDYSFNKKPTSLFNFSLADSIGKFDYDYDAINDSFDGFDDFDDLPGDYNLQEFLDTLKSNLGQVDPISPVEFWVLFVVYTVFIVCGFCGNVLILWAVLGRENMRTARNVFIVTLAISDLFLCLFTMPSKLWEVRN